MIGSLIVGAIIGGIAGFFMHRERKAGCLVNIVVGLLGSALGQGLCGTWGPSLSGMALIPSILGAVILLAFANFISSKR